MDLGGAGLQSLNLRLARELKSRRKAYLLLAAFPLGLHRFYLESRVTGALYPAAAMAALLLQWAGLELWAASTGTVMALAAAADLWWIEGRVAALNKQKRLQTFLGHGATPPSGYAGRVIEPEQGAPQGDDTGERPPSFAEQERLLREMVRRRGERPER